MRNKLFATAKGVISLSWFIAVLFLFVAVASEFAYGGTWTTKTSMPAARSVAAAGVINGVLYVAGGNDGATGGTTTLQAYNPTTDTWNTLASMPGRRYNGDDAGVINGKLYVAGEWNTPDSSLPQSQLFVYDLASNSWSSNASMPTLSGEGASGVINGKLYVTTATNGYYGWRDFLHVYEPATNTWSSLASSPNVHNGPAFGVINGKFYLDSDGDGVTDIIKEFTVDLTVEIKK